MASKRFDKRANFLLMVREQEMLGELAERDGLTASDVVRQLIRRAHAAAFGEPAAKPSKTRKARR